MELFAFLATVNDEAFSTSHFVLLNVTPSGGKIAASSEWFCSYGGRVDQDLRSKAEISPVCDKSA
jgi:hypothetical protein